MRRLLRIRLLFVLIALLFVPAFALPYADRLRTEWTRFLEPPHEAETLKDIEIPLELTEVNLLSNLGAYDGCGTVISSAEDFPATEAIAKQENFLRAMEAFERRFGTIEPIEEVHIGYPDAARWAEIEAEARATRRANVAGP